MDVLAEPGLYERQRALGDRLPSGLRDLAAEARHPGQRRGPGHGLPALVHRAADPRTGARPQRYADEALFTRWWQEMLLRGVLFHPSQYENLFVSLVHTDDDIDETLDRGAPRRSPSSPPSGAR